MKKKLQTAFSTRQHMLSKDFEIYYYSEVSATQVKRHTHEYYEIYLFLEGDVMMEIDNRQYPLKWGDIVLIPPHTMHRAIIRNDTIPYRRFIFWVSQEYCNQLMTVSCDYVYLLQHIQTVKNYIFHNDVVTFHAIQTKVVHLIDEIRSNRFGKEAKISLCVNDLILQLNRITYEQNHPKSKRESQTLYENIINYIDEYFDQELTLEKMADALFVSKYHIAHVFKDNLGLSIHQYITKKRVTLCRDAILNGNKITEVYRLFGFKDYSSFFRAFKKEYGISPKEFREMERILQK